MHALPARAEAHVRPRRERPRRTHRPRQRSLARGRRGSARPSGVTGTMPSPTSLLTATVSPGARSRRGSGTAPRPPRCRRPSPRSSTLATQSDRQSITSVCAVGRRARSPPRARAAPRPCDHSAGRSADDDGSAPPSRRRRPRRSQGTSPGRPGRASSNSKRRLAAARAAEQDDEAHSRARTGTTANPSQRRRRSALRRRSARRSVARVSTSSAAPPRRSALRQQEQAVGVLTCEREVVHRREDGQRPSTRRSVDELQ